MRNDDLRSRAQSLGLGMDSTSPGDGRTRYRFTINDGGRDVSPVLIGRREAETWLRGFTTACALHQEGKVS